MLKYQKKVINMVKLDRRTFLKFMGQGTAALGVGFSLRAGAAGTEEESDSKATLGKENTSGKY